MKTWITGFVVLLVIAGGVGGGLAWRARRSAGQSPLLRTAPITRGDLLVTIDATGTLEPEEVIDVGAQVAGQILSFGKDAAGKPVDYGSPVTRGATLALIDEALPQADVQQAEAGVKSAQAGVQRAEADVVQLKAGAAQAEAQRASARAGIQSAEASLGQLLVKRTQAQRDWERAQRLGPSEALAQTLYDGYQSTYDAAQAGVAVGEAALLQATAGSEASRSAAAMATAAVSVGEAAVLQAKASLTQAETSLWRATRNLGYCTITSPVDGVIIDRRVNIGQTVVASLNTPSLFLIAKDLKRMQVWVAVNEADVTSIYPGQAVAFTVDARPDESFSGEVVKVRLNAAMTQNVVTYTVEIGTDNSLGRLLPYLTANVKFEVHHRENVLLVPNAALRWTPAASLVATEPGAGTAPAAPRASPPAEGRSAAAASGPPAATTAGVVYVASGSGVRPIPVRVGLSNGMTTEVAGEELAAGTEVVTGTQTAASRAAQTTNPFAPKLPRPPGGRMSPH
jgi:HlyD family secretion protein